MKLIEKLERKFGRYAIKNLTYYIMGAYIIGWLIQLTAPQVYNAYLSLNAEAVLHGQIWRILTFLVNPPSSSMIFMIFTLYLYYFIGTSIERAWGAFRFNLYYFTGVIFHVIAAVIIFLLFGVNYDLGTYYLNMSLFLAFAALYPDMQLLLFFIIPVKIKWLALLDIILFAATIVSGFVINFLPSTVQISLFYNLARFGIMASLPAAIAALVSLLNFIIFFLSSRNLQRVSPKEFKRRNDFRKKTRMDAARTRHKCAVCGRTENDGDDLVFRYCSKCGGNREYCQDHLFTHKHVN
ncbi:rhomboid family protein [Parasporobacterium paucivorans]|uniref:Membrane associated serine protease, rhomboid family n=1 Tax=Parasporobacterium paucivorans DSM 15970 TaxID=1122934 RepID=A0A1M6AFF9_9FIRM|nr:hypothetical protein [Parasporobacterium paucivorans]SHI35028.1 hypothetical protein SAMN02745691_00150 [Parasporobacterium paucivorans DSM 15970]